jgi:hypothetical protein
MNQVPEFLGQISPGYLVDRHPGIKAIITSQAQASKKKRQQQHSFSTMYKCLQLLFLLK